MNELDTLLLFIKKVGFNYKLEIVDNLTTLTTLGTKWYFTHGKLIGNTE